MTGATDGRDGYACSLCESGRFCLGFQIFLKKVEQGG